MKTLDINITKSGINFYFNEKNIIVIELKIFYQCRSGSRLPLEGQRMHFGEV